MRVFVFVADTRRRRTQDGANSTRYTSTLDAVRTIVRTEGPRALYRGAGIVWSFTIPGLSMLRFVVDFAQYIVVDLYIQAMRCTLVSTS